MSFEVVSLLGLGAWRHESQESRRRFGVPPGGSWDREAACLCRALAGVSSETPVFELLHGAAEIIARHDISLALTGVGGGIEAKSGNRPLNRRIQLMAGEPVKVQARMAMIVASARPLPNAVLDWSPMVPSELRFLPCNNAERIEATVDPASSRAGVRLNTQAKFESREQPSEPSCVGAIQCTPSGQLIVIGPDGPTIGGYPRIGTIIDADLDLIPRLAIDQSLVLNSVDMKTALDASQVRQVRIGSLVHRLQIVRLAEML